MTSREYIYIKNKYTKIYFQIINSAKSTNIIGYTEKHHIIPRSLGGSDDKLNLVKLTARQHYICHLLLTKMVEPNSDAYHKMVKAYMMMSWCKDGNQDRSYKVNSRLFESMKIEFSKLQSIQQTGKSNSQYGTMWVYNPTSKENKKINKNDQIEDGWLKGKVDNWETHFSQMKCKACGKQGLSSNKSKYCSKECRQLNKPLKTDRPLIEHIYDRCKKEDECLIWKKSVTSSGFPQFHYNNKNQHLMKYLYELYNGIVEKGFILKHVCFNRRCLNPKHIYKIMVGLENFEISTSRL